MMSAISGHFRRLPPTPRPSGSALQPNPSSRRRLGYRKEYEHHDPVEAGQEYGSLTAIECIAGTGTRAMWRCRCRCGAENVVRADNLQAGSVSGCSHKKLGRRCPMSRLFRSSAK